MDPAWILLKAEGIYNLPAEIIKYLIRQFIIIPRIIQRQMYRHRWMYPFGPGYFQAIRSLGYDVYYAPGMREGYYIITGN